MFRQRDRKPPRQMMPWAGEFAGKYLTHAVQIWRLTRDAELGEHIGWFVAELTALQDEDGYLGPWSKEFRLRKGAPNTHSDPWDAWGHYHAMIGLLLWHQVTNDKQALHCVRRIADMFCDRFLDNAEERMHDAEAHEMNQAPVHSLAWLYRLTGEPRYLRMAEQIVEEFAIPPAGDYLNSALAGKEFWETPKPRWESLHPIMGLHELYLATGKDDYRKAFMHLWWSMLKGDRHNTGGFSSGEKATGNPYDTGPIETCCTVAWMAMSLEMLRLQSADRDALPVLDAAALKFRRVKDRRWIQPLLLLETISSDGAKVQLCDFASAGVAGTTYETWLPVANGPATARFAGDNPLRTQRV